MLDLIYDYVSNLFDGAFTNQSFSLLGYSLNNGVFTESVIQGTTIQQTLSVVLTLGFFIGLFLLLLKVFKWVFFTFINLGD